MIKRYIIPFVLFLLTGCGISAQTNDAQLWLGVNIEKRLTPKLSIQFAEELRMNENVTEAGTIFSDFGVNYRILKELTASANYRFINKRQLNNTYDNRHRYYFDLTYKYVIKPVSLSVRALYQSQYTDLLTSENGKIPENYERTRLKLGFNFGKPVRPFVSAEMFIPFSGHNNSIMIDCMRYTAGLEYKFNARHSIDGYYLIQKEMNVADPKTDFVIGLGYSFLF